MTSAPSSTTTTKTVNNKTGVTTATSTSKTGSATTTTKTTTIGTPTSVSSSKSSVSTPSTLPGAVLGTDWITGPNTDGWTLCAPVAIANALLGATGTVTTNAGIERLHARAGGTRDTGVPIVSALAAAQRYGLAGCRLKGFRRAALDDADVLLLQFHRGVHSAAFAGMTVITWGGEVPLEDLDATILDAWSLTWHGTENI